MKEKMFSAGVITLLFFAILASSVSASSSGTVWYQDEGEAHIYDLNLVSPVASDTTHGLDNYLALSAEVFKVRGPDDIDHPSDYTQIDITVGVSGNSEYSYQNSLTQDSLLWERPKAIEIDAKLCEVPSHNANIDWQTSYSGGVNVGGDEAPSEDMDIPMENTLKESTLTLAGVAPYASWGITPVMLWGAVLEDLSDVKYIEDIDGSQGSGALVRHGWDIPDPVPGDDEGLSEDLIYMKDLSFKGCEWYEGTMNFTASSKIEIKIPATHTEELSVDISARVLMEKYNNGIYTDEWGAQTEDITITIHNAVIESVESENEGTNTHLSTEKYVQLSDVVSVELNKKGTITDPDDGYGPNSLGDPEEIPKIDLTVDWGDDDGSEFVKEDWEPYYWEYMDYNSWKSVDKELSISNTYNLEAMGINPGDCETISVEITAEVHQEYGG